MFRIAIKNVGKEATPFRVVSDDGMKRDAKFETWNDAMEACKIIDSLRIDSAYQGSHIIGEAP